MIQLVLNDEHFSDALAEVLSSCRRRIFIATADVKDLHVPAAGSRGTRQRAKSILEVFEALGKRDVQIHLLHSGVPSGPFLARLKRRVPGNLLMRRCVRVHAKAIIVDGQHMYLGSANLTGAGLGAKSPRKRNFEAGIWTDDLALIDPVADMLQDIFEGRNCPACLRKEHCPVPLEEPEL